MANISISQLIDASPKLRLELSKALKLKAPEMTEENPEKVMMSALSREDVARMYRRKHTRSSVSRYLC